MTRVGYLGPEGTFSHEALVAQPGVDALELVSLTTVYDTVMAVDDGRVDRAFVPMENSLEGSVNATLDTLALETDGVAIVGEFVHPVHQCLIAGEAIDTDRIATVLSHPQANAQCARFLRTELPRASVVAVNSTAEAVRTVAERDGPIAALGTRIAAELPQASVVAVNSTAEAVRTVAERDGPIAALGTRIAAELYGAHILRAGVEDAKGNETRFVWLAPDARRPTPDAPAKTTIVFWGAGSERPGWLARCLTEFAQREVSLTKIESRPRKVGLGRYMFFLDCEGGVGDTAVAAALEGVRSHVDTLKVLGSYPAA